MPTAGRLGFEPRYTASEAVVLPLDDLPAVFTNLKELLLHRASVKRKLCLPLDDPAKILILLHSACWPQYFVAVAPQH